MSKVKIGFLGCGYMGQLAHMQNYAELLDDCEIVAVCDKKIEQAKKVAKKYDIPKVYSDFNEFLADDEIEAVVSAQPFTNHINLVPAILKAKKHLLTEKPLCVYPENAKKLADAAEENGKIHMVAYHKRSDHASEYALDVINKWKESGEMGAMKYVRITMPPGYWNGGAGRAIMTGEQVEWDPSEAKPDNISEEDSKDLITFVNYYIHQVNYMRFMLGEDFKLTFADKAGVLLAVESDSGVTGVIEMQPYETTDDWQESALICFEKGWVKVEFPNPLQAQKAGKVTVFENNEEIGKYTIPVLPNESAMRNQARNFIKSVRGERNPPCASKDAVKDIEFSMDYIEYK